MVLGNDQYGVAKLPEHLEAGARQSEPALDRLIGVGDAGERNHLRLPGLSRQLLAQQRRGIALDQDLGLEVEARREAEGLVCGARETIGASMLATSIRIEAVLEPHVWALIACEDRARSVREELGPRPRRLAFERFGVGLEDEPVEAVRRVDRRTPSADRSFT